MTLNLDEIEARANAATSGPWKLGYWTGTCKMNHMHSRDVCNYEMRLGESERCIAAPDSVELIGTDDNGPILNKQNAAFISHARTDIPNLIQAVRERDQTIKDFEVALSHALKERNNLYKLIRKAKHFLEVNINAE